MIHLYLIVSLLTAQPYQFDDVGYEYYEPIVINNLFRPLGWTRTDTTPRYELIGTIIGKDFARGYIKNVRDSRTIIVEVGTILGDGTTVSEILRNKVRIEGGKELVAGSIEFLNVKQKRSRSDKSKSVSTTDSTTVPSKTSGEHTQETQGVRQRTRRGRTEGGGQWQAQIEQFQNASPDERQRMIQEFRQMRGNRSRGRNRRGRGD